MKKVKFFAVMLAAVFAGGVGAYMVIKFTGDDKERVVTVLETPQGTPVHFTSYTKEGYPDLTYAAENAVKAVVSVETRQAVESRRSSGTESDIFEWFFGIPRGDQGMPGQQQEPQQRYVTGGGSGVIISPDGYIVSNNHVVESASELHITLFDGRNYTAKLIGTDPYTDIALLKIEADDLPYLAFGDSEQLRLGEWVLAIGSPIGLNSTITAGIVSAKSRSLGVYSGTGIESFIQTDAAVNPGNSGGPLVNTSGEVVGINSVIKSETGSFIGYSFAVPSSIVKRVITDIKEYGVFQRPYMGIQMSVIDKYFVERAGKEFGITEVGDGGVVVVEVDPDGAAHAAGIRKGDILESIDDVEIHSSSQVQEVVSRRYPGDKIKVSVKRDGKMKHFEVVLRNRAGNEQIIKQDAVNLTNDLGGQFSEINDRIKRNLKIEYGISVTRVKAGRMLDKAGIRAGFVITHINEKPIRSVADLSKIIDTVETIDGVYQDGRFWRYKLSN